MKINWKIKFHDNLGFVNQITKHMANCHQTQIEGILSLFEKNLEEAPTQNDWQAIYELFNDQSSYIYFKLMYS